MSLRYLKLLLSSIITVFLLTGCNAPELDKLPADAVILAFGDSLTAGVGTTPDKSYPAVLASITGRQVINRGISGEETAQGLSRLPQVLADTQPDLVILIEGGNDILRNRPAADIKQNLAQMITLMQQRDIPVVLLGMPEKKLFSSSAALYQQLADDYQLVYDNNLISDLLRNRALKSDPVHFNAQGYQQMAEGIHQLLRDNGAL
jgi:lysophospholipase L1-like esterase